MPGRDGSDGVRAHHRGRRNVGSGHAHAATNIRDLAAAPWSTGSKPSFPWAFRSEAFGVGPLEDAIVGARSLCRNARTLASTRTQVVACHPSERNDDRYVSARAGAGLAALGTTSGQRLRVTGGSGASAPIAVERLPDHAHQISGIDRFLPKTTRESTTPHHSLLFLHHSMRS